MRETVTRARRSDDGGSEETGPFDSTAVLMLAVNPATAGFRRWAGATDRESERRPEEDASELSTAFGLMPDYPGIDAPSWLNAGCLSELLLDVYPRKVTVLDLDEGTTEDLAWFITDSSSSRSVGYAIDTDRSGRWHR